MIFEYHWVRKLGSWETFVSATHCQQIWTFRVSNCIIQLWLIASLFHFTTWRNIKFPFGKILYYVASIIIITAYDFDFCCRISFSNQRFFSGGSSPDGSTVFPPKPVKVKRSSGVSNATTLEPLPTSDEQDGVYKAETHEIKAETVREDENTKVDLPIDQVKFDFVALKWEVTQYSLSIVSYTVLWTQIYAKFSGICRITSWYTFWSISCYPNMLHRLKSVTSVPL